ncbi:NADP-dependent phosphogluconate dehydrogenase [Patescibacteria group bacterium]|nr:NADP-dependent phosphogluconate dehydrogenase [Patescibacteria group bacterium]
MKSSLGLIGLGTMGSALARNIASHGFKLSVWNRTEEKINKFINEFGKDNFYPSLSLEDFVESLEKPRKIIIMVPAGPPTLEVIKDLLPLLAKGDSIMDGGNAFFKDTEEIQIELQKIGIQYLGTGISGGEEGALKGPSIMPGGTKKAYSAFETVLQKIAAADFSGKSCVSYMGNGGAGHFVKMVHNGIEYAEIQMLIEAYDLLKKLYKLPNEEIANIFKKMNEGILGSFLLEISIEVLQKKEDGQDLLDLILDTAGQKGTGTWTAEEALKLEVPIPTILSAVFVRQISNETQKRKQLESLYPIQERTPNLTISEFSEHLENALITTRLLNYEQGFELLKKADKTYKFNLNFAEIARVWQGGCIIRSKILKDIHTAQKKHLNSLLQSDFAHNSIVKNIKSLRLITQTAIDFNVTVPAFSSAIYYFDAIRRSRLSVNLLQGLRDRFGAHGYARTDKEGFFHTKWP